VLVPAAREFRPQLILISAGFDGHRDDPLAGCSLEADSYAKMASHIVRLGEEVGAPVGAVLEGGYDLAALPQCVLATIRAFNGEVEPESIAPYPLITSRVAAHVGHYWTL
jgi:acetoin utilization deacetylase AcuC-like enzyme